VDRALVPEEDEDVPGFWRALGLPGLADVHVHFLPPRLLRRVWQYFDEAGPLIGGLGMAGKILLGSDFPNLPYPYARQLAGLAGLELGEDWLRAVCWDNPVAIFGLPEAVGGG
jgi:predicted TIM-barrel fold metal-dependent hydrolase